MSYRRFLRVVQTVLMIVHCLSLVHHASFLKIVFNFLRVKKQTTNNHHFVAYFLSHYILQGIIGI